MGLKRILIALPVLVLVVLAVAAVGPFQLNLTGLLPGNKEDSSKNVEKLYELLNPGTDVTIEKYEEVSGMYKVLFKAVDASGAVSYREVYITKDGELLTESVVFISQSIDRIASVHNFVDCLDEKGVRIFGVSNQTATILQLNALGGTYAVKLYVDCAVDVSGECASVVSDGVINQVPSVVYNDQGFPGVQSISFFQNLTGCTV